MDMICDAEARRKSSANYGSPSSNLLKSLAEVVAEVSAEVAGTPCKKDNKINGMLAEVGRKYMAIYYVYRGGTPRKCAAAPMDAKPSKLRALKWLSAEPAFCDHYACARNTRAGYSAKTASSQGERLLRNVEIDKAISAAICAGHGAKTTCEQGVRLLANVKVSGAVSAAIRVGYSAKTAYKTGAENLRKPQIAQAISAAMKMRAQRTEVTPGRVLKKTLQTLEFHPSCLPGYCIRLQHASQTLRSQTGG